MSASRRRRRRHRGGSGIVEINLAAMLDMAFQLLAFFVLTFRPSAIEGHFQVHLPPPIATTKVESPEESNNADATAALLTNLEKLDVFVKSDSQGRIMQIRIGSTTVVDGPLSESGVQQIDRFIKTLMVSDPMAFTSIQCHADGGLLYGELMQIVGVCTKLTLPNGDHMRLNLVELKSTASVINN
jgi:biopolymer transport protein ExbD